MVRILDKYLIREIVPYFLLSLVLLTAIIFAQEASRFTEMLVISSRAGLPMLALWKIMAALVPGIFVFTLPISLLVATLVGLGRLSGDSEIVALVASGMSRFRILRPVVGLALVVTLVMVYLTFNVLPLSITNLKDIKNNQTLIYQGITTQIKPRVFEESIPKKVIYIEDIDRTKNIWHNIFIVDTDDEQGGMKIFTATTGMLRQTKTAQGVSQTPELYLQEGSLHQNSESRIVPTEAARPESAAATPSAEAPGGERKRARYQHKYDLNFFQEMTYGVELTDDKGKDEEAEQKRDVEEMNWGELTRYSPPPEDELEWRAELHKRLAYPAACLVFALLGVGFGISHVRTGRPFGLLLGLAITVIYYLLALSGEHSAVSGKLPAWLGVWMANLILTALGSLVLYLQRKPGSDVFSILRSLHHSIARRHREPVAAAAVRVEPSGALAAPRKSAGGAVKKILASRWPQLIDRLVIGDLLRSFFYILGGFTTLFIIITLFQLLNAITKHNIEWGVVANYLFFLLPLIANYTMPMAALVAVMITFGVLQKTSQVVALKASGQSIYRLAAPAVVISILLGGFVFINQDYIMPFTNPRQNNLRAVIRSGQEPAQTFYQKKNQWMFGHSARIFNYAYFNPTTNTFADLNVIDLVKEPFGITRRLFATRAIWDEKEQAWIFQEGWERRFSNEKLTAFETFKERKVELSEKASYFRQELRGSQSLTVADLRRQIGDLSQAGFDVIDLKIALQSKIAFPLTCFIMVLVGLPFAFSVGKRGALYGVAIGIAIGLAYWGTIGLFEQMGRYEVLPPLLAAWGPNLLFGAGGIYLFLTSRT